MRTYTWAVFSLACFALACLLEAVLVGLHCFRRRRQAERRARRILAVARLNRFAQQWEAQ